MVNCPYSADTGVGEVVVRYSMGVENPELDLLLVDKELIDGVGWYLSSGI